MVSKAVMVLLTFLCSLDVCYLYLDACLVPPFLNTPTLGSFQNQKHRWVT